MKKMYKIFGAVAIIGLFLLSSIASTSLAKRGAIGQKQSSQVMPSQVYGDGEYEGEVYEAPDGWGWDDDETLPFPPSAVTGMRKPQLVITRIKINRIDDCARFTVRIRNVGKTLGSGPSIARVTVTKGLLPVYTDTECVPTLVQFVGKKDIETDTLSWNFVGGSVIGQLDIYDDVDEYFGDLFRIRIRHFLGNAYVSGFSQVMGMSGLSLL